MNHSRAARWASALALAVIGLGAPSPATAQPVAPAAIAPAAVAVPAADPGLIPDGATGSLTIHKLLLDDDEPAGAPGDGRAADLPPGAEPLPGVVFTARQVTGVDLTTAEGWRLAAAYQSGTATLTPDLLGPTATSAPTDASGVTVLGELPVGLYLVHEAEVLGADGRPDPSVLPGRDFLVTVPMTDPEHPEGWLYDLHVYPKNSRVTIAKSVADGDAGVAGRDAPVAGRVLSYTLRADIPAGGVAAFDGHYEIVDDLAAAVVPGSDPVRHSADYLELTAPDWPGSVRVSLTGGAGGELTACASPAATACDYVLTLTPASVSVSMTERGLGRLAAADAAAPLAQVEVVLAARVRPTVGPPTLGSVLVLPNTAVLVPSGSADCAITSNTVRTVFAALRLHKVDAASGDSLAGAGFTLYRTRDDALAGRDPLAVTALTGADGMALISGVHVTDFADDAPASYGYWLVESTAPDGYTGLSAPIEVRLSSDGTTALADGTGGFPVPNTKGGLAWTGADVRWLLLLGIGLVVLGGLFGLLARRRDASVAEAPAGEQAAGELATGEASR